MDLEKLLKNQEMGKNTLAVSDNFVDIYKNFNVYDQIDKIKNLDQRERYLLIILCLDKHDNDNPIARANFLPFEKEALEIYDLQDDKPTTNTHLNELIDLTGDKSISTDVLVTKDGFELPEPLSKEEVRDVKIDKITEK